jgi:hypothetical protein
VLGGIVEVVALIRDVAIIVLALETIVIGVMVLILVWQLWRLIGFVRRHIDTLVTSANEILGSVKTGADAAADAASQVKTTTGYVSTRTVMPVIEVYSAVNGASRFAQALFRLKPRQAPPRGDENER